MQIAVVGLGKMGYNLSLNLHRNSFEVFAYDINKETRELIRLDGINAQNSLKEMT